MAGQGFVQNSYALGLHPHEYFFPCDGRREGLVDTAVKTATTGYIQRRQIKSMEDHKVCYDGTVRNAEEYIIDFSYGGDGMDAARIERVKINILKNLWKVFVKNDTVGSRTSYILKRSYTTNKIKCTCDRSRYAHTTSI